MPPDVRWSSFFRLPYVCVFVNKKVTRRMVCEGGEFGPVIIPRLDTTAIASPQLLWQHSDGYISRRLVCVYEKRTKNY
jgi:hypothetical protein